MSEVNSHFLKLKAGYLFPEIAKRVREFSEQNPAAKIIRLGIGDVTQPLPQAVIDAGKKAFDDMGHAGSFRGYGPEQGYDFLREAIAKNDYQSHHIDIDASEIFVSDGSKCDTGNIQEIFSQSCLIAVPDPVYPVYVDTNVMAGRTGVAKPDGSYEGLVYLKGGVENSFLPELPTQKVDLIYLCFPNNPTGVVATKNELKKWVDYAKANGAIILFDAAYEAFITEKDIPHSIYEIEGAKDCAIEFRSFSKSAGFTGTRCAFTVVPKNLMGFDSAGEKVSLHALWNRRQSTKFNGVSYPVQRAAEAVYSPEGKAQIKKLIAYYMNNAKIIREHFQKMGFTVFGGINAPYIWFKTPQGYGSWDFFNKLLHETHIVGTPGAGFGACGEGFFRLSAFGLLENIEEAMQRLQKQLKL